MSHNVKITLKWNEPAINLMNKKAVNGLFRMGYDIANQARRNAPYKTGALRNSIRVQENSVNSLDVIAGGIFGGKAIRYAAIQEFGGKAGRNHSVTIQGKHYMERAKDFVTTGDYLKKYFGDII